MSADADTITKAERNPGIVQALALLLPITMAVMGSVVLQPVQGLLREHFAGMSGNEYWVPFLLTVPAMAAAVFAPVSGFLADVFGRRPVLLVAMAVYVVVGVAPFFLTNFLPIAASRIAVGLTEGVVLTVTTALLGDYFKGRARDRLMGFQAAIATISASLLIPLSGYLGASIGWNGPFLIYGLALLWFLGILLLTWEPAPDLAAGERKGRASWQGFPAARMLEICAVTVVGGYFFYTAQFEVPNVLPQFGVTDPARIGALMGFVSWGMVTGSLGYQFVVGRPLWVLLVAELGIIALSFLVMSGAQTVPVLIGAAFLNQIGCGALLPTLLTASIRLLPFEHRGRGTGIWQGTLASSQFIVGLSFPAMTAMVGGQILGSLRIVGLTAAVCTITAWVVRRRLAA